MNRNRQALENLYENMRLVCYQLPNFLADFENEYYAKTDLDKKISEAVQESLKTCLSDVFDSADLVYNILCAEDDAEVITCLAKVGEEA